MPYDQSNQPTARCTIHKLLSTVKLHRFAFDGMRETTGLGRTAHRMLMQIADKHAPCSQTELAEALEISAAAVAVMLKKLEADGYVCRKVNPADTRFNRIALTEKGTNIVNKSHEAFDAIDNAILDGFSEAELLTLNAYIDRMHENIQKACEKAKNKHGKDERT